MILKKTTLFILIALIGLTHQVWAANPIDALKNANESINKLLGKNYKKGSKKEKANQKALKRKINQFLDFNELARRSLGKHWKIRTKAEQQEFTHVLRTLIEKNYLKQARKNVKHKVEYGRERVKGNKAIIATTIKIVKNKRPEEISVVYKMRKVDSRWMVYDVITDDVSIVKNYRSQFNRIITKNSFEHLLKKMHKKAEKLSS